MRNDLTKEQIRKWLDDTYEKFKKPNKRLIAKEQRAKKAGKVAESYGL